MKTFKDLTPNQKKDALDITFKNKVADLAKGVAGTAFNKLSAKKQKEITDQFSLCGCLGCRQNIAILMKSDNELKEIILSEAQLDAENAYYPDQDDIVIDV